MKNHGNHYCGKYHNMYHLEIKKRLLNYLSSVHAQLPPIFIDKGMKVRNVFILTFLVKETRGLIRIQFIY